MAAADGPSFSSAPPATPMSAGVASPGGVLLLTRRAELADQLAGIAAAVGVALLRRDDLDQARRFWSQAALVLLGEDFADELLRADPPRRDGVVLVGPDGRVADDPEVWRRGVAIGAEAVIFLPEGERWLADRIADAADGRQRDAPVAAVLGGRGGAGASTVATAMAVTAARAGLRTTLVDADPLGGGIDLLAGVEELAGLRWPDLSAAHGRVSGRALREALPSVGGLSVLSWDRGGATEVPDAALRAVLSACRRGHDLVVVDLPRACVESAREALLAANVVFLVVPAELRALAAASLVRLGIEEHAGDVRAIVRLPAPGGLTPAEISTLLGLPVAGVLRTDNNAARDAENGLAPGARDRGPLAELCRELLRDLLGRQLAPVGLAAGVVPDRGVESNLIADVPAPGRAA